MTHISENVPTTKRGIQPIEPRHLFGCRTIPIWRKNRSTEIRRRCNQCHHAVCNHLDTINALHPVCKQDLNKEQLLKALGAITMVKMKRCGRMKGRTITNGSSQHEYTAKED